MVDTGDRISNTLREACKGALAFIERSRSSRSIIPTGTGQACELLQIAITMSAKDSPYAFPDFDLEAFASVTRTLLYVSPYRDNIEIQHAIDVLSAALRDVPDVLDLQIICDDKSQRIANALRILRAIYDLQSYGHIRGTNTDDYVTDAIKALEMP